MIYDLIIVGSGSVGSAAGWYATKAGLKVLTIDNGHPPHDQGSHHGETRLIRHAYGDNINYLPMVLRAQRLWDELEQLTGEKIMHRCGVINIGPKDCKFIRNVIDSAKDYQVPVEILTAKAVTYRWPQITVPDDYIGVYDINAGYLKCETAVANYIRLAKEAGCTQLFNCPVTGITRENDLQKVETANGSYLGRKVLLSAGTWVKKLLTDLPITPTRKVFSWHKADDRYNEENKFPGFSVVLENGSSYYGFPANNNVLKVGKHTGGQPINDPDDRKPFGEYAEDNTEVFDFLQQFLPGVGETIYGKACSYDNTVDGDFIIDTKPGEPNNNILIISGLSGHGFKFSSVLGEIATSFAQGKPLPYDLSPFSLSRFADKA